MTKKRPNEFESASHVSYARALEDYCSALENNEIEGISRDALIVNLMREHKINKHLARNCAVVVMQMLYEKRNVSL